METVEPAGGGRWWEVMPELGGERREEDEGGSGRRKVDRIAALVQALAKIGPARVDVLKLGRHRSARLCIVDRHAVNAGPISGPRSRLRIARRQQLSSRTIDRPAAFECGFTFFFRGTQRGFQQDVCLRFRIFFLPHENIMRHRDSERRICAH